MKMLSNDNRDANSSISLLQRVLEFGTMCSSLIDEMEMRGSWVLRRRKNKKVNVTESLENQVKKVTN